MKSKLIIQCLLIAVIFFSFQACSNKTEETNNYTNVEVELAGGPDESQSLVYSGTIEESESIPLSFSVLGNVKQVLVSEGDIVRKGQLLAVLNDETYKNTYNMTLASYNQAEDAYQRLLKMYNNGNLPEIKFVEIETAFQQAKAASAIAKDNLDDCKLYSPVDGVVGRRSIDPGMSAVPNIASINIVKIDKVYARVAVSEREIASVKKGDKAKIKIAALNDAEYSGIVEEIGVLADPIAHTYKIKIGIINKNKDIKPGMICNVILGTTGKETGLAVPTRSVMVDEKGKNYVYAVEQNRAVKKYVVTGNLLNSGTEILGGLNKGDVVIVSGQHKLADSSVIHIIKH
ncbi:MAG: efflux RND transporter periplasmic adaptor subunit [Ignavibacteriaceae bacterium]